MTPSAWRDFAWQWKTEHAGMVYVQPYGLVAGRDRNHNVLVVGTVYILPVERRTNEPDGAAAVSNAGSAVRSGANVNSRMAVPSTEPLLATLHR